MTGQTFEKGTPACPVACKYCFITEHDDRRARWNRNPVAGINRACLYLNWTPWALDDEAEKERWRRLPWDVCQGEVVGSTAITDPLWPKLRPLYWDWAHRSLEAGARLVTSVTKWPLSRETVRRLARLDRFRLVVTITGTGDTPVEKIPLHKSLHTLELCVEEGVRVLPIVHPYLPGLSDLSWLPLLRERYGLSKVDFKGLRHDPGFEEWMPPETLRHFQGTSGEVLIEDGWRQKVKDAGLDLVSPRRWYLQGLKSLDGSRALDTGKATLRTRQAMLLANITTSSTAEAVFKASVHRRTVRQEVK